MLDPDVNTTAIEININESILANFSFLLPPISDKILVSNEQLTHESSKNHLVTTCLNLRVPLRKVDIFFPQFRIRL